MANDAFSGPIDYAVIIAPRTAQALVAIGNALIERETAGAIEVLDAELVSVVDATPTRLTLADLGIDGETAGALAQLADAETDLLDDEDLAQIAAELSGDEVAVCVVYEDRSLAPVAALAETHGGRFLWAGGVTVSDLEAAIGSETEGEN